MNSGNELHKAISAWMSGVQTNWIDSVSWPLNSPCAKKKSSQPAKLQPKPA